MDTNIVSSLRYISEREDMKLASGVNVKKLEKDLWESADLLRADSKLTSNEYCMPVLGLIFLRYAYSRFKRVEQEILKDRPVRNGRVMPVEASDFTEKSALYLPEMAQYAWLVNLPEDIASLGLKDLQGKEMTSLGNVVNNAMELIEQLVGVLPKEYTNFSDELLSELLRIFNNNALDDVGGDIIGRIYEYFLSKFAPAVASDDGVFFTPKSLVKMIVNVLEPNSGTLLDPACGSGGMFVQTGDFVNSEDMAANKSMTFFGQEKVTYNAKLCLMNMAVHGLTGRILSGDAANTFYHDAHSLEGRCDYVMANPPFNVDKVKAESAEQAGRLPFGMPSVNNKKEVGNANYLWISYFYDYLKESGRAGFVMASSATDSQGNDKDIREKLIRTGHVDCMISVANNFFYTKSLPCTLWFFDRGKKEEIQDKILFIDARNYYTVVDRTLNEWNEWQLKNLNAIIWLYRGETEKYQKLINDYYKAFENYEAFDWNKDSANTYEPEYKDDKLTAILTGRKQFAEIFEELKVYIKNQKNHAKVEVVAADRRSKKKIQSAWDERLEWLTNIEKAVKEACWLYEKFGDGVYKDIPGLCKIAYTTNGAKADDKDGISTEEKGWSLTPGAYVGVAPVEDDGVDFEKRMAEIHKELLELQAESNSLMDTISANMKEMGL